MRSECRVDGLGHVGWEWVGGFGREQGLGGFGFAGRDVGVDLVGQAGDVVQTHDPLVHVLVYRIPGEPQLQGANGRGCICSERSGSHW